MDQNNPGEPEPQQPSSGQEPMAPPQHQPYAAPQPYQPPAGGYAPQQDQPQGYPPQGQPQGYPPQQGYQPQPGQPAPGYYSVPPPPAQPKKGFNWPVFCGITCGCLLIVAVITVFGAVSFGKRFQQWGSNFDQTATEVQGASVDQIKAEATVVDSRVLSQDPSPYTGQWIALEGEIQADDPTLDTMNVGQHNRGNSTAYTLAGPVLVLDLSNSPRVGQEGDRLRAYGKVVVFDMSKMPMMGKFMEKAMEEAKKSDPNAQNVPMKVIMFYTQSVEKIDQPAGGSEASGDKAPSADAKPKW
jgi:hypothetical protein